LQFKVPFTASDWWQIGYGVFQSRRITNRLWPFECDLPTRANRENALSKLRDATLWCCYDLDVNVIAQILDRRRQLTKYYRVFPNGGFWHVLNKYRRGPYLCDDRNERSPELLPQSEFLSSVRRPYPVPDQSSDLVSARKRKGLTRRTSSHQSDFQTTQAIRNGIQNRLIRQVAAYRCTAKVRAVGLYGITVAIDAQNHLKARSFEA
jgi:hypothetical protein